VGPSLYFYTSAGGVKKNRSRKIGGGPKYITRERRSVRYFVRRTERILEMVLKNLSSKIRKMPYNSPSG
jgi:hypothetical protein